MNLTPEQEQAVTERGRDVIVTAGAGSGKTRVLVERYVSLLQHHEIDQLVAVTFTDAAAAEMRGRVREAVMDRPELARHVQHLDRAIIGTIHSLCLQLLRENPVEASIDPGATVLDENVAQAEILAACRDAIESAATGEGPGTKALLGLGIYQAQSALPGMVARRDEVLRAYSTMGGDSPEEWGTHIKQELDRFVEPLIDGCRAKLTEHRDFLVGAQVPGEEDALTPTVERVLETLDDLTTGTTEDLLRRLERLSEIGAVRGGSSKAWSVPAQQVRDVLSTIRTMHQEVAPFLWDDADAESLPVLDSLRDLFLSASKRYEERKRELAALDFLDLELKAIEMLSNESVAAAYRDRLRHILVDEAQDLNPTQYELLDLLAGGKAAGDANARRPERFFVGDVKQSIYRFRRSDVRKLKQLKTEIEAAKGATVSLNTSFRSHERLVDAINGVMTGVLGDASEDYEASMEPMSSDRQAHSNSSPVEILQIASAHKETDGKSAPTQREGRRMEAHVVAQRIKSLIDIKYKVWDRDAGEPRAVEAKDIVILLRSMIHVSEYERALENSNIAYRTASTGDFYNRSEIIDLTNLLEWLAEPANDIALVGLLRSPFFAIDDESLIALKGAGGSWFDALRNPPAGVLPQTRPLCIHAARVLDQLREESRLATPEQLLENALILTNYEASWAPLRGSDQVLANIRQFVGMARGLADKSVDEVVEYIRLLRDDLDTRAPQAALDAVDAVRLMTIHSAKGLEFPVVILAETGATQGASRSPSVLWRADKGISLTLEREVEKIDEARSKPAFYSYLAELEKREDQAESKRLLYVAATRAADLVIVTGIEPTGGTPTWLGDFIEFGNLHNVQVVDPVPVDLAVTTAREPGPDGRQRRSRVPGTTFDTPPADSEQPAHAPLLGRRGAIPIRSSTPATAFEDGHGTAFFGRPDPLALTRGTLAHMAIEEWFKSGTRPGLRDLVRRIGTRLSDEEMAALEADVNAMLDDFDTSDLAATLRSPRTRTHFELPFSWEWGGVAVHGSIDLAYETNGAWHVVDFKTDRVENGKEADRASAYLTQLGVYAGAIETATGPRPRMGLMFLRTRTLYWVSESDINTALSATRQKIDDGEIALGETDMTGEFADEPLIV